MPSPRLLSGLSEIASQYDALLCDAWGVIHNGREVFDGVAEALIRFRQERGPVIILTNAPRLSSVIPAQLDRLGLPREAYDGVVTSGDATRQSVIDHGHLDFYKIGPAKDDTFFQSTDVRLVPFAEAGAILCTGPEDDERETPEDYRGLLEEAAARELPMICANPDKVVRFGDRLIYCAGAIADLYETLGGQVVMSGKPHPPIYAVARDALRQAAGREAARLLAVGDGLHTDILGANREGIDVIFNVGGVSLEEGRGPTGDLDAGRLRRRLDEEGLVAQYATDSLKW
ncbi:HAD-superfamily subfamily IIA hydrolase [Parvularcula bermudensis HTCC2503]|uniref:HAD-superfamily subfamily IIA hydrolase n=1 Tax=Parvularcula bermudensis (strain ATCC BAA-594 / HTCC2503 / KCTC 12087) TaxID=314260 RepID=E0TCL7_PARBH|nr:TIGR01459 family HAD-type hydrolase [Parvularcula bermudensis]ADM08606.1 HAD-superfamily subfamily IIA hydrolase [Parvularcula bermudensis HTCC2503]